MLNKVITQENAAQLIKQSNGSIFSVQFVKVNGQLRNMVCRNGVSKDITGKGQSYNPADYDMVTVFDMSKQGYRMIRLNTLKSITMDKETYSVIQ